MSAQNQPEITVELAVNDQAPPRWRDESPTYIHLKDRVASAFLQLLEAGSYGVHVSEFRRDVLARFDQFGVRFKLFESSRRGTKGKVWCRLNFPPEIDVRLVANGEAGA